MSNPSPATNQGQRAPDVLFVCVHNSGRSVAAKLIFNDAAAREGLALRAESTGTNPGSQITPKVATVFKSMGRDASNECQTRIADSMLAHNPAVDA